ncbi:MAG: hypothetical protein VKQ33_04625 [Candidatus Sericytochromatia bacterium]|nr:hypothetical protein [Candidatus Sericytochromatia bacterium]
MQVHYFLIPEAGAPFAAALEARLAGLPTAFRHPDPRERTWVVAADAGMARWLAARVAQQPDLSLVSQGLVILHPAAVEIWQDAPREILATLEPLVTWFLQAYPCQVLSEEGEDWTARYAAHPHALFVEEDAWA